MVKNGEGRRDEDHVEDVQQGDAQKWRSTDSPHFMGCVLLLTGGSTCDPKQNSTTHKIWHGLVSD